MGKVCAEEGGESEEEAAYASGGVADRASPPGVEESLPCTNNRERQHGGTGEKKCTSKNWHRAPINAFRGGLPEEDGGVRAKCHGGILPRF
jgi:hypothetical protein